MASARNPGAPDGSTQRAPVATKANVNRARSRAVRQADRSDRTHRPTRPPEPTWDRDMTQQHEPQSAAAPSSAERSGARSHFQSSMSGLDNSSVMGAELMLAIVVWTGIGWLLDEWLGTGPVLMIVGALVGNFAGLYLIWLRSGRMEDAERRAAAERQRPRVVTSPVKAVVDAVVAGRTGVPTAAHTHGIDVREIVAQDAHGADAAHDAHDADDADATASGGRLLEH